jgi:2-phosphoglycerate kinase
MNRIECSVCSDERCQQNNFFIESVYVLPTELHEKIMADYQVNLCTDHLEIYMRYPPNLIRTSKYNRQQLRDACKFMGVKISDSYTITNLIFGHISDMARSRTRIREGENYQSIPALTLTADAFESIARRALESQGYIGESHLLDFNIACEVISKKRPVIVLLGGASGTGKSTLSSLLASRLGISSMLSTDSIRHILRNVIPREQIPVLFCSTYEAGKFINTEGLTDKQACIQGYLEQSDRVFEYLVNVVEHYHICGNSIVIEGVHLHIGVMKKLMKRFPSCLPFVVYIKGKKKHMERFAVRTKYMTLDPSINKYVASFPNIREIQKRFLKKADECLIPKVESSNLDRSLGLCHATIIRCLRQVYKGESIYNINRKQTVLVHEEFNFVARNIWSSKIAHEMIKTKVNKGELFERFFRGTNEVMHPEEIKKDNATEDSLSEPPEIGSIVSGSVEFDLLQPRPAPAIRDYLEPMSVGSIASEEELEDDLAQVDSRSGTSNSGESDHSIHEEEVPGYVSPQ